MAAHAFGLENREPGFGSSRLHVGTRGLLCVEQTRSHGKDHERGEAKMRFHSDSFTIPQHIERCMQPARQI
jgi:hypothetical protein